MATIATPVVAPNIKGRRAVSIEGRQARLAFGLLLPTFIVLLLVAVYPLGKTLISSFTDEQFADPNSITHYIGLQNYQSLLSIQIVQVPAGKDPIDVLPPCTFNDNCAYLPAGLFNLFGNQYEITATDPDFIASVGNTLIFTIISVALELLLGLGVALVVSTKFRGRGALRTAMLVPWAIPTVVSTLMWKWILKDNSAGVLNDLLVNKLHLLPNSVSWVTQYQLPSIILIDVWKTVPFIALLLLAGLQLISADVYEAAAVDGASAWQKFTQITLPLLRPTILLALIFRTLDALRAFDVFSVLFGNDLRSIATYAQQKLILDSQTGYSSAIGVVIFVLLLVFTIIYMTVLRVETD